MNIFNSDDTASTTARMRTLREIESEGDEQLAPVEAQAALLLTRAELFIVLDALRVRVLSQMMNEPPKLEQGLTAILDRAAALLEGL